MSFVLWSSIDQFLQRSSVCLKIKFLNGVLLICTSGQEYWSCVKHLCLQVFHLFIFICLFYQLLRKVPIWEHFPLHDVPLKFPVVQFCCPGTLSALIGLQMLMSLSSVKSVFTGSRIYWRPRRCLPCWPEGSVRVSLSLCRVTPLLLAAFQGSFSQYHWCASDGFCGTLQWFSLTIWGFWASWFIVFIKSGHSSLYSFKYCFHPFLSRNSMHTHLRTVNSLKGQACLLIFFSLRAAVWGAPAVSWSSLIFSAVLICY